ncbi:hypothetical protein [Corynebacterium sp. A21]|uniref:hypothetical protein n=1 Tax=Corynebacterium sp. A21 TaxID=3457318 RepID=UPI003FD06E84
MSDSGKKKPHSEHIILGLSEGNNISLGANWKITSKKNDFYITPVHEGDPQPMHVSLHGPNDQYPTERFHVKIDRKSAKKAGLKMESQIPKKGASFSGKQVGENAFLVARLRWSWHLQRNRFREITRTSFIPPVGEHDSGLVMPRVLQKNHAWDIDIVISREAPFWPSEESIFFQGQPSNEWSPHLGPLSNDSGLWLTGTSYHRDQILSPTPESVDPPFPKLGENPCRILSAGIGDDDVYWMHETITSEEFTTEISEKPQTE